MTWIYVRSTINMQGLLRDDEAWIDADDPVFGPLLEALYIVPIDPPWWERPPAEEESE